MTFGDLDLASTTGERASIFERIARVSLGAALSLILLLAMGLASAGPAQAKYASIVVDAETGEVLHARHSNTRRHPASLVKMMVDADMYESRIAG